MSRIKLKCGGKAKRKKALFGTDGALMAAATLAAAGMNVAATLKSSSEQARAVENNARRQADAISRQAQNDTELQKQNIEFTKQQNAENRQQQQDIQATLQLIAGEQNTNDRMRATRKTLKRGGVVSTGYPSYGGATELFEVLDGGGVVPLDINNQGHGLYEIIGNDHEHYHKTRSGKYKSGVGIKLKNGNVIEGEGNQNTNNGELLYITPEDALFISKHSIDGFNPAEAVKNGMNPEEAFVYQEAIKNRKNLKDDGSKKRKKAFLGISDKFWDDYGGATINAGGNLLGAGLGWIGNTIASNRLSQAYDRAGKTLARAYRNLKTIDESLIDRSNYAAPHQIAAIRSSDTNINPALERIRRNAAYEENEVNRGTLSSAARQQRLAAINDRMNQRASEQYAYKHNADEQIRQKNIDTINQTAAANADRDQRANEAYGRDRLALRQYNNDIVNQRILGAAQAMNEATVSGAAIRNQALQSGFNSLGTAINASAAGFSNAFDTNKLNEVNYNQILAGSDPDSIVKTIIANNDKSRAVGLYNTLNKGNAEQKALAEQLKIHFNLN